MELVQRWWNGRFGRLARRDVWLEHGTTWRVRARQGDGDSATKTWTFNNRAEADALVHRLITAEPADGWKDITDISSRSPKRDQVVDCARSVPDAGEQYGQQRPSRARMRGGSTDLPSSDAAAADDPSGSVGVERVAGANSSQASRVTNGVTIVANSAGRRRPSPNAAAKVATP